MRVVTAKSAYFELISINYFSPIYVQFYWGVLPAPDPTRKIFYSLQPVGRTRGISHGKYEIAD